MNEELKPCPCGKVPTELCIIEGCNYKWGYASGMDCCGDWEIEFRTNQHKIDSDECYLEAVKYWNLAPRSHPSAVVKQSLTTRP